MCICVYFLYIVFKELKYKHVYELLRSLCLDENESSYFNLYCKYIFTLFLKYRYSHPNAYLSIDVYKSV